MLGQHICVLLRKEKQKSGNETREKKTEKGYLGRKIEIFQDYHIVQRNY